MGDERDGLIMTGIGIAVAAAGTVTPPAPPLSASVNWVGDSVVNVSGSSGLPPHSATPWIPNVLSYTVAGGVPPYSESGGLINNPSGKLYIALSYDGSHNTIGYSNLQINEIESTDVYYSVSDAAGSSITDYATVTLRRIS
jgi:hypothetical protein